MKRIIFHIDVNNAFLSWTAIDMLKAGSKIDIRTIPSVVGGDEAKRHGIVLAKSMPAKKAGIVTGEPLFKARRKVDKLYVAGMNRESYIGYSNAFYKILCNYSPKVERYSIDECFLDMTGTEKIFGDPVSVAYKIKNEIKEKLGFTVNVGVANCKLCAKMASDFEKPDKVHTLFDDEIRTKMWPLKVDDLFMSGKSSSKKLHELGIHTIKDLANADINLLAKHFKSMGNMLHDYANGIDNSMVEKTVPKNKGIGNSTTLPSDVSTMQELKKVVKKLSSMVGIRLRKEGKFATVISVQLRNSLFLNHGHQKKLINPISSDDDIYDAACLLVKDMWNGDPIRLVGIRVSDFTDKAYEQISLFDKAGKKEEREKMQKILDEINSKFGSDTIKSAALFDSKSAK